MGCMLYAVSYRVTVLVWEAVNMNKYPNNNYFPSAPLDKSRLVKMFQAAAKNMNALLKRSYSSLPEAATAARTASTPRAVRLRRARKTPTVDAESDALPSGLTPTE